MLDVNVWINLLVLDHNGDGRIQSGNELFGNGTDTASGKAVDGFAALAQHDLNGDSRMYMRLTYWQWNKR